jgi:hypothetical protein
VSKPTTKQVDTSDELRKRIAASGSEKDVAQYFRAAWFNNDKSK